MIFQQEEKPVPCKHFHGETHRCFQMAFPQERVMMREIGEISNERWIKHYSSGHSILLVGEGDFSFSLCLGMAFGSATNIVATSLDSYDALICKYKNAISNLSILNALGASLLHGVDATQMNTLPPLQFRKFDRIIYNFPHAGFLGKEDNPSMITMHRNLVNGFLRNASTMLRPNGEIHINHKTTAPFNRWGIEHLALYYSGLSVEQEEFNIEDYPWYRNKRGSGLRPDDPFPLGSCRTFKFKLQPEQNQTKKRKLDLSHLASEECRMLFGGYISHMEETFGSSSYDVSRRVEKALRDGYELYKRVMPGRALEGFTDILEQLHRYSVLRSHRLRLMLLPHQQ